MSDIPRAVLFCLLLLLAGCASMRAPSRLPDIRIAGLEPERIGLNEQVFRLRLVLSNPNDVALRVAAARLRLDLEDISAGTGELVQGFSLPAGGQGDASVRIVTDLLNQGPRLLTWLMSGDRVLDYRVSGYVDLIGLGLGRMPVDERGRLALEPSRAEAPAASRTTATPNRGIIPLQTTKETAA